MKLNHLMIAGAAFAVLVACTETAPDSAPQAAELPSVPANLLIDEGVNSGGYELEETHASLIWTVSHNGLSKYTARFTDFDASLTIDPENPANSTVLASINPLSVETSHPSGDDWDTTLGNDEKWFNATAFPKITYTSTSIELTGERTGTIMGELTLLGITKSVPMDVTYNNVRNFSWYGERDVIGFSATANLKRSDFGMMALLPGIGDEVSISIEAEFVGAEQTE
ncbi:MAG: YceI family protein [Hyphomonadaceae bacterium]